MTGSGTAVDPYIIYDVNDLQAMQNDLDAYYKLANDIDASVTSGWNDEKGFIPIAQGAWFTGQLDGKEYSISSLFINRPTEGDIGLFDAIDEEGTVQNVKLVNADIKGKSAVGILAGNNGGTVKNCSSSGSVIGRQSTGGLIGANWGTITNSYSSAAVSTEYYIPTYAEKEAGGLVGCHSGGTIEKCYATGNVSGAWDYRYSLGGLIGCQDGGTVSQCYATGDVTGYGRCGGFVGFLWDGTIDDCYARGDVIGISSAEEIGGFCGENDGEVMSITNCYSTGAPSGTTNIGGFCGLNEGAIINCFWDIETSGFATSNGGTGKTTDEMKTESTFTNVGWDFITIWNIDLLVNDGYPHFMFEDAEVAVYYRIDHEYTGVDEGWTELGKVLSDGENIFKFGTNTKGINFYDIQFKFKLTRGSCNLSPNIKGATLSYSKAISRNRAWSFVINTAEAASVGTTPKKLCDALATAVETKTLLPFTFRDGSRESDTYYVMIQPFSGSLPTGTNWDARFELTVIAVNTTTVEEGG